MKNIFLQSNLIILEPLEKKHLSLSYISWLNDEEITRFNSHGIYTNTLAKTKAYIDSLNDSTNIVLAIIDKETKIHIGNIAIQNIDLINSNGQISIMIGEKEFWGKGYAFDAFSLIISHCFNKLNLNKISAGTTCDNIGMQKVLTKLNMIKEGCLREAVKRDNKSFDIYLYGLLKIEYLNEQ